MSTFNSRQSVHDFNIKCANLPADLYTDAYWKSLKNQVKCLQEELNELDEALMARDRVETVDALADLDVVLSGLIFFSQHDHEGAMKAVCENNNLKYTTDRAEAEKWAGEIEKAKGESVHVQVSEFDGKRYYSVHRDSDNKIMKPVNHPRVDLSKFVAGADELELMIVTKPVCPICSGLMLNLEKVLKISNYSLLDPFNSEADHEFCVENGLVVGDIVYYNGTSLVKTNYGTEQFDIVRVGRWLKGVGAL